MSSSPPAKKSKNDLSDSDEGIEQPHVDNATQRALEEIDGCQHQLDSISEKSSEAILKIEKKYNRLRKPLYEKRSELITKLPNFWVTVFVNHPQLTTFLDPSEEDSMHYLRKLEIDETEDLKVGYRIKFHFEPNPYFLNELLTKELHLGNPAVGLEASSNSTPIVWKEGKNLITLINKRNRTKFGKKRGVENTSFFKWFVENSDPATDEIAEVIKDDLWPNPLQYYLSPDVDFDANEEAMEEDDDDDEEEDDEEEKSDEEKEPYEPEVVTIDDEDDEEDENEVVIIESQEEFAYDGEQGTEEESAVHPNIVTIDDEDDDEDDNDVSIIEPQEEDGGGDMGAEPRVVEGETREEKSLQDKSEDKDGEEKGKEEREKILKDWDDAKDDAQVMEVEEQSDVEKDEKSEDDKEDPSEDDKEDPSEDDKEDPSEDDKEYQSEDDKEEEGKEEQSEEEKAQAEEEKEEEPDEGKDKQAEEVKEQEEEGKEEEGKKEEGKEEEQNEKEKDEQTEKGKKEQSEEGRNKQSEEVKEPEEKDDDVDETVTKDTPVINDSLSQ